MRLAPAAGVGSPTDISRCLTCGPAPDADVLICPLCGIHTALRRSPLPVALNDGTAGTLILADGKVGVVVVTVGGPHNAALVGLNQVASTSRAGVGGVDGGDVVGRVVPVLIDVNLAVGGPVSPQQPVRGPRATDRLGEVGEGGNEETRVVGGLALKSDTVSARPIHVGYLIAMVDTDVHLGSLVGDYSEVDGILLASVVDETTGRVDIVVVACAVLAREEIEFVKEVGGIEALRLLVRLSNSSRSCTCVGQGNGAQCEE